VDFVDDIKTWITQYYSEIEYRYNTNSKWYENLSSSEEGHQMSWAQRETVSRKEGEISDVFPNIYKINPQENRANLLLTKPKAFKVNDNLTVAGEFGIKPTVMPFHPDGTPVVLTIDIGGSTSTTIVTPMTELDVDVGGILLDAFLISAARYTGSPYSFRIVKVFRGILRPFVKDKFTLKIGWGAKHAQYPDSPVDSFTFTAHVSLAGHHLNTYFHVEDNPISVYAKRTAKRESISSASTDYGHIYDCLSSYAIIG